MRFLLFFLLLSPLISLGQKNIMVSDVSTYHEPSIYINEFNAGEMIAGTALNQFYKSTDSGNNWSTSYLHSNLGVYGDPAMLIDTAGQYYFFHLSNPKESVEGHWVDRIVCQTSKDQGKTWSKGTGIGYAPIKNQDKHWPALNPKTNEVYLTWTQFDKYNSTKPGDSSIIFFSKTSDQGKTWSTPLRINKTSGDCLDNDNTVEGAVPTVGNNGEIYVSWSGPTGIRFDRSLDNGKTWLAEDILVDEQPGGWTYDIPGIYRCNGLPITCADRSNTSFRGNIYVSWSDQRHGTDDTDIWFKRSEDGGNTWSDVVRVNDDKKNRHQFFNWMCVDQSTGYIYIVFYDRRCYKKNEKLTDVYLAYSKDGGRTFKNKKISEEAFVPHKSQFFGDYNNISAVNGVIRPIWTRMHNFKFSIWTALINEKDLDW